MAERIDWKARAEVARGRKARRRVWVRLALLLILILGLPAGWHAWRTAEYFKNPWADFPEFDEIDPEMEGHLRELWTKAGLKEEADLNRTGLAGKDLFGSEKGLKALAAEVRMIGPSAALPALKLLLEMSRRLDANYTRWGPYWTDDEEHAVASVLAEFRQPGLNAVLLRVLESQEWHSQMRDAAVVALCFSGNEEAASRLMERALDRNEPNRFREQILYRLPRIERCATERLRALLYEPFCRLDALAAAALIYLGDVEAPSLLLEGLWESEKESGGATRFSFLMKAASQLMKETVARPHFDWSDRHEERRQAVAQYERWLDESLPKFTTRYEALRREYLEGPQRAREMKFGSAEELLRMPEEDVDFASAALLLSLEDPRERGLYLEKLNRLALSLRERIGEIGDAEGVISILNERLFRREQVKLILFSEYGSPESFLSYVFENDYGNCLGYSSLYLAVAERLGLPIFGVESPFHVFVRYDDGRVRRNIECTAGGVERTDQEYIDGAGGYRIDPVSVKSGLFLRNCGRRTMISSVLNNLAALQNAGWDCGRALHTTDVALGFDGANYLAYLNRAIARHESELDAEEAILADLEQGIALHPNSTSHWNRKAIVMLESARVAEAMPILDHSLRISPKDPFTLIWKTRCLLRMEGATKAREHLEQIRPQIEEAALVPLELEVTLASDSSKGVEYFESLRGRYSGNWGMLLDLCSVMNHSEVGASEVIRVLSLVTASDGPRQGKAVSADISREDDPVLYRDYHVVRGRAHLLLGNQSEAAEDLARAQSVGKPSRELLKLERDLKAVGSSAD